MDAQVVDAGLRDVGGLAQEVRDAGAGHLEGEHLVHDRADGGRRLDRERGLEDVPVEDHVQVLVGRDPDHDPVRDGIVRVAPGVAVRDPGRELLERHVGQAVERVRRGHVVAALELVHPSALEQHRIDVAGDGEVVAQHDRVAALLRRPAPDPGEPRAVAPAEHPVDQPVVARQVVLREEVDLERRLGHARQPRLVGGPGLRVEVAPEAIRDVVVREPLLGHLEVAIEQPPGLRLQLLEQAPVDGGDVEGGNDVVGHGSPWREGERGRGCGSTECRGRAAGAEATSVQVCSNVVPVRRPPRPALAGWRPLPDVRPRSTAVLAIRPPNSGSVLWGCVVSTGLGCQGTRAEVPSGLVKPAAKRSNCQQAACSRPRRLGGKVSMEAASPSRAVEVSLSEGATPVRSRNREPSPI